MKPSGIYLVDRDENMKQRRKHLHEMLPKPVFDIFVDLLREMVPN